MKAKKIYEVINFERGGDPKKSMGIGLLDIFIKNLEKIYPNTIRFNNYAGMPGGQFSVPKYGAVLPGWKHRDEELKDIFGEEYIKRIGDAWPQDWWFVEIKPQYADLYHEAFKRVYKK